MSFQFTDIFEELFYWFLNHTIHLKFILAFIAIFLVILIFLFVELIIVRSKNKKYDRRVEKYGAQYRKQIMDFVFSTEHSSETIFGLKPIGIQGSLRREILTGLIGELSQNLLGDTRDRLQEIYFFFGLDKDSKNRLKSKNWDEVVLGINQLSTFGIIDKNESEILSLCKSENPNIREAARIAIIRYKEFEGLKYLSNHSSDISELEQTLILNELTKLEDYDMPDLTRHFESKNPDFLILLLKLCQMFNLNNYYPQIKKMLKSGLPKLQLMAVRSIGFFNYQESEKEILELLHSTDDIFLKDALWTYVRDHEVENKDQLLSNYYPALMVRPVHAKDAVPKSSGKSSRWNPWRFFRENAIFLVIPLIVISTEMAYHLRKKNVHSTNDFSNDLIHDFDFLTDSTDADLFGPSTTSVKKDTLNSTNADANDSTIQDSLLLNSNVEKYIVFGSFISEQNAIQYKNSLSQYDVIILQPANEYDFYRVIFRESFKNPEEYTPVLDSLKKVSNMPKLWIYRVRN